VGGFGSDVCQSCKSVIAQFPCSSMAFFVSFLFQAVDVLVVMARVAAAHIRREIVFRSVSDNNGYI